MSGENGAAFRDKIRSLGVIGKRTRPLIEEGTTHPATGLRFKATTDELGNTVTEHSQPGATGVSARQDVVVRPKIVEE